MATPTQYSVTHKELVELLLKQADIHEGRWVLSVNFGFAPGLFGPNEEQTSPGVAVVVNQVMIQREVVGQTGPSGVTVDAAVVNPPPHLKKK